jgi:hypothetical protein
VEEGNRPDSWTNTKKKSRGRHWQERSAAPLGRRANPEPVPEPFFGTGSTHGPRTTPGAGASDGAGCIGATVPANVEDMAQKPNHLTLDGQMFQLGVSCLIDTGATDSLVSFRTYARIPEDQKPLLTEERAQYTGVDGRPLKILGRMDAPLTFGRVKVQQNLLVADVGGEVLLGMDFLMGHQCSLDLYDGSIRLGPDELQCWELEGGHARYRAGKTGSSTRKSPLSTRSARCSRIQSTRGN